ncbi:PREDICTED: ATP-dependent RNA helicase DDX51-like [Cyprinodon variegatus]|uniref:ATP-dependent RNA helicase DDX51-like n=1 Tax=Cyprinodon variegatus TaxID=28743 RepID=UPI0007429CC0|nr:PREDICTED: ATP-dependent RNA helicase DDX51-like [Cyprinodon variegatus]
MSLFLVNRYLGDEEDDVTSKESHSQQLLNKLQQKVKQKQRQSLTEQRHGIIEETKEHQEETSKDERPKEAKHQRDKRKTQDAALCDSVGKKRKKDANRKQKSQQSVQAEVIPAILDGAKHGLLMGRGGHRPRDICVSAPTGSGKTLSFVIPVIQALMERVVCEIRALAVLPTKELAQQVYRVFASYAEGTPLRVALLVGQRSLAAESASLSEQRCFVPMSVQAEVIPAILDGAKHGLLMGRGGHRPRDICVSAPTGSGKTLSFVIPVIQALMERVVCEIRALAVLPTKELAQQVYRVFASYAEGTPLRVALLVGQRSLAAESASLSEQRGSVRRTTADIVVATPGRLVDLINKSSGLCLDHLRFLIIDEADRMMDSMHQSWLSQVVSAVHRSPPGSQGRAIFRRTNPACITAARWFGEKDDGENRTVQIMNSGEDVTTIDKGFKHKRRWAWLEETGPVDVCCLTPLHPSVFRLHRLVQLFGGVHVAEFSSRLSPGERKSTLKDFEQGKIQLLISTDAAARGIDINGVKCVLNYDAPQYIRTYVHRVGRTARAGKSGLAFTFLLRVQETIFLQMVKDAGSPGIQKQIIKPESLKGMEARYEEILQELADVIKEEKSRR